MPATENSTSSIRIGFISRLDSGAVEERLSAEATKRGHTFTRIVFSSVEISSGHKTFEEANLLSYDVLYYRTTLGYGWAYELEGYLRQHGRTAINLGSISHPYRQYKTNQTLAAVTAGLQVPKTIIDSRGTYSELVKQFGAKFIIKADNSSQGKDVHLVLSEEEFDAFEKKEKKKSYFYQEYIPHAYDYRVYVIGGHAVAAQKRTPAPNDFRTNMTQGASAGAVSVESKKEIDPPAERIATALGLDICVVDFLRRTTDGLLFFLEVNDNPGWDYLTDDVGVDMAALVVDFFEKVAELKVNQ